MFLLLMVGCLHHLNWNAFNAVQAYQQKGEVPFCGQFYEGQEFPDGSVVDQINGHVVVVISPNPSSAEGEQDHPIPCRKE